MAAGKSHDLKFRPRARLVSILGEHLISDHAVGLIELVKNAYDADATEVIIDVREAISMMTKTYATVNAAVCWVRKSHAHSSLAWLRTNDRQLWSPRGGLRRGPM